MGFTVVLRLLLIQFVAATLLLADEASAFAAGSSRISRHDGTTPARRLFAHPPHDDGRPPTPVEVSRRNWISTTTTGFLFLSPWLTVPTSALAKQQKEEEEAVDPVAVQNAFDAVRTEVQAPTGGVAYLKERVEASDFPALLDFTKTYEPKLRKGLMGKAKKFLVDKQDLEKATAAANAVTFDLIGVNRSSRPGQENQENAAKYVQELKDDVQKFLDLQPKL